MNKKFNIKNLFYNDNSLIKNKLKIKNNNNNNLHKKNKIIRILVLIILLILIFLLYKFDILYKGTNLKKQKINTVDEYFNIVKNYYSSSTRFHIINIYGKIEDWKYDKNIIFKPIPDKD